MRIRLARDEDYTEIAHLRRQTIRHVNSKDYPAEAIRTWSAHETTQTFRESTDQYKRWVALDKDKIIGFCEHNFEGEISRIYVHRNHLRKGVGTRLLGFAEASLRRQGHKKISIESTVTAKDFYAVNGYKLIEKAVYKDDQKQPIYKLLKTIR